MTNPFRIIFSAKIITDWSKKIINNSLLSVSFIGLSQCNSVKQFLSVMRHRRTAFVTWRWDGTVGTTARTTLLCRIWDVAILCLAEYNETPHVLLCGKCGSCAVLLIFFSTKFCRRTGLYKKSYMMPQSICYFVSHIAGHWDKGGGVEFYSSVSHINVRGEDNWHISHSDRNGGKNRSVRQLREKFSFWLPLGSLKDGIFIQIFFF